MGLDAGKAVFGVSDQVSSNQSAQLHRLARIERFHLWQVTIPYFPISE